MYARFASHFHRMGLAEGFRLMGADAPSPSEATYFNLQKTERETTFLYITVCDTSRADWRALLEKDAEKRMQAENLLGKVRSIALVYLMAEPGAAIDTAAVPETLLEPYEGQPVYSIFWRINMSNGKITVPSGQPAELFGLRALAKRAYEEANAPVEPFDAVSAAESLLTGKPPPTHPNIVPIKKPSPRKHSLLTRIRYLNFPMYPKYNHALCVYVIIAVNAIVLAAMYATGDPLNTYTAYRFGANFYPAVLYDGEWWRLVTAMFVHYGWMHFLANTMGLIIIGTRVERYFGRVAFLTVYFLSGILGSLFCIANAYLRDLMVVSAGASGAVYGLMGSVLVFTRLTRLEIETLSWRYMLIWLVIGVIMGFTMPNIGNAAHLGGFVGGAAMGFGMLTLLARRR
ncbi:MAG: rhomboid family intramembrane serine protease [Defluviitaleaceae bacterium]|nr:rhomboid family intramembrane serine protease [Defluviitaleaceae bacterium]